MSAPWNNTQLRTVPLRLVREQATIDEVRRKRKRTFLKEMIKPAIVGAALLVGFLMQTAGLHWESIIVAAIAAVSTWLITFIPTYLKNRQNKGDEERRTSDHIADLDFKERERIDAKQEQFIEMVRELHTQQTQNMQAIIDNQKAIIENQKEAMKLKDAEIDKRGLQIAEMQNQLLKEG